MSTQCVQLAVLDDTILEGSENFTVQLSTQSSQVVIDGSRDQAEVVIREDNVDSM